MPLAFIQNLGAWEIFLIFLIVLMLFGAKRLPDLFRSFGKSITEFKKATQGIEDDIRDAVNSDPQQTSENASEHKKSASSENDEKEKNTAKAAADPTEEASRADEVAPSESSVETDRNGEPEETDEPKRQGGVNGQGRSS